VAKKTTRMSYLQNGDTDPTLFVFLSQPSWLISIRKVKHFVRENEKEKKELFLSFMEQLC